VLTDSRAALHARIDEIEYFEMWARPRDGGDSHITHGAPRQPQYAQARKLFPTPHPTRNVSCAIQQESKRSKNVTQLIGDGVRSVLKVASIPPPPPRP